MEAQGVTVTLFVISQVVTLALAIGGWIIATRRAIGQLKTQHSNSLDLDRERLRQELTIKAVMELIGHLNEFRDAGTKLAGIIRACIAGISGAQNDPTVKSAVLKSLMPNLNSSLVGIQSSGLRFIVAFDSYEPIVSEFIADRDQIFATMARVDSWRTEKARSAINTLGEWVLDNTGELSSEAVVESIEHCSTDFEPILSNLIGQLSSLRTKLLNRSIGPLFDHEVDPDRAIAAN